MVSRGMSQVSAIMSATLSNVEDIIKPLILWDKWRNGAREEGHGPKTPRSPSGVGCPYIGAPPRVQWRRRQAVLANFRIKRRLGADRRYGTEMRAQSRRPINTQSWVLRRSAMLMASQIPTPINATVTAK